MKNKKLIFPLVIVCVFSLIACDKTPDVPSLTPEQKTLTNKIWKLQSLTVPQISDPTKDSSIMQSCADSALMAFDVYGNYQLANGSKSGCDSIAVPYGYGTWALSSDNDSLFLKGKRNFAWKLEKLNDTIVTATFRDSISPEKSWLKKITLK